MSEEHVALASGIYGQTAMRLMTKGWTDGELLDEAERVYRFHQETGRMPENRRELYVAPKGWDHL